jgi:translation initiation factor 1A
MPGKTGGKKGKRGKKAPIESMVNYAPKAEKGQLYAIATQMLGNRRLKVKGADGKERLAIIPGKFKGRRFWIGVGTLVLINERGYQEDKSDVIYIYSAAECKFAQHKGWLGDLIQTTDDQDCGFEFGAVEETEVVKDSRDLYPPSDSGSDSDADSDADSDSDSDQQQNFKKSALNQMIDDL